MTNRKSTKRALITSALSVLMCGSMLVGTTFAWFTDTVTSGKNKIVAGNLDVELYTRGDDGNYTTKVTKDTNLFEEDALWEPGHVEVAYLKIVNEGSLALTYKFAINAFNEKEGVNVAGEHFKLSEYLKYGIVVGDNELKLPEKGSASEKRKAAIEAVEASSKELSKVIEKPGELYPEKVAEADETGAKKSEKYVALVVYMPETVDNVANYKTSDNPEAPLMNAPEIDLAVNLVATQVPYERDSFDDKYDESAKDEAIPDFVVSTSKGLAAALSKAKSGDVVAVEAGEYELPSALPEGVTISGNGAESTTIKIPETGYTTNADLTITNVKIDGEDVPKGKHVLTVKSGDVTLENVEIVGGGRGTWDSSVYVIGSEASSLTVKDSSISGAFRGVRAESTKADITIENCDIDATYPIHAEGGTGKLTVKNSRLHGWTSYGNGTAGAEFTNVTFTKGTTNNENNVRGYVDTTFNNCEFGDGFWYGAANKTVTVNFNDCTAEGTSVTADNVDNVLESTDNGNTTVIVNGSQVD